MKLQTIVRDVRGGVLVFFIVCLPVVVGAVGFVVDLTRAQTVQTQLQRIADAAALAAARELDLRSDSLTRAEAAALGMANRPTFATSSTNPQIITPLRYYSDIVSTDAPTVTADVETFSGTSAKFVRVRTVMRTSSAWFVKLIRGGDAQVDAEAWAQSSIQACGVAPLFFCVNKAFNPVRGTQVKLKAASGNNSTYVPGNFGLLDPPGVSQGVGAKLIMQNLAAPAPSFCLTAASTVRTGQVSGPVESGVNVRFDIYKSGGSVDLSVYPPASNVIKGMYGTGNKLCDPSADTSFSAPLPQDSCIAANTCWQGTGDWKSTAAATNYFNKTWGTPTPSWIQSVTTRYELYLAELQIANEDQTGTMRAKPANATIRENRTPACYQTVNKSPSRPAPAANRRTINVAVADCESVTISGNSSIPLRVVKMAKFFITEPSNSNGDILAEFIEESEPGDGGIRHLVQLVR